MTDERDHDLGHYAQALLRQDAGRLDDRASLHLGDLRVRDADPHATVAEHRIEFVELVHPPQQRALFVQLALAATGDLEPGDLNHEVLALRQELVERRAAGADGHRCSAHRLEDAVEVLTLER